MKNIYVCMKQVPDTETKIQVNSDQSWIDTSNIKWIVSPYDEYAIEEALQLRAKTEGAQVTVLSAGPERVKNSIRTALAMGADRALHVDIPEKADPLFISKALASALKKDSETTGAIDVIFTGKEAIDDGGSQVSQLIASHLDFPCVNVVNHIEYGEEKLTCHREVEGGTVEVIETQTPAIIGCQKGLNEPRYASLPNIMKAKKKEIQSLKIDDLGISETEQKMKYENFELPPPKEPGRILEGTADEQVKELVRILHEEKKVI